MAVPPSTKLYISCRKVKEGKEERETPKTFLEIPGQLLAETIGQHPFTSLSYVGAWVVWDSARKKEGNCRLGK